MTTTVSHHPTAPAGMKSNITQPTTPADTDTRALASWQQEGEEGSGIVVGPSPSLGDNSFTEPRAATRFGKGMRVLCMSRLYDIAGEFSMDFHLEEIDNVMLWARAQANIE